MGRQRQLRVLIAGQREHFDEVLAVNLQRLGYDVKVLPEDLSASHIDKYAIDSDIVLYDLDEPYRRVGMRNGQLALQQKVLTAEIVRGWEVLKDHARLIVVLSSYSVARPTLERMGAVALVYKPFEIGHLQRYLWVFRQMLLPEWQEGKHPIGPESIKRVLVVDDDARIARSVSQYLREEAGFAVEVAHDGLEALERCIHWQPHCVVIDLIMPRMNGYQVMHSLAVGVGKAVRSLPAFVVVSALPRVEGTVQRTYLTGNRVEYIDKPFRIEHLVEAIKQVCLEQQG